MSAHVLLNLLNEVRKSEKLLGNEFNNINYHRGARVCVRFLFII